MPSTDAKPRASRLRDELAFLPAALEVVETPPSPIGRAIAFTIVLVFCAAAAWASLGTVDIVAVAPGKIIPSGRTKLVQPLEAGVVRAIHVRNGQRVRAGEVLIELDPTINAAELGRLTGDLLAAQLDVARLQAALAVDAPLAAFRAPPDAPVALVEMHRGLLASQTAEQEAKLAGVGRQQAQKEAEGATLAAMIDKLEAAIPLLDHRVGVRKHLADREIGSRLQYLADLQELTAHQQEVLVLRSRIVEADAAVAAIRETRARTTAEYRRSLFDELARAEQKASGIHQEVVKAGQKARQQQLTAPVDGAVHQLSVHTVGGVVTPAQALLAIVPADSQLEVEAIVSNRDVGFLRKGQQAEIKVDAFMFTRYGLVGGKILDISSDAVARDSAPPSREGRADPVQELEYVARISLDSSEMQIADSTADLSPGMTVSVEIRTGTRSIVDYLLSPLGRYRHDSFRER
jgi:hemolysin D